MKLLCAQVLKDLLGEGIDVRFVNNRAIHFYMLQPRQLNLIFFFVFFQYDKVTKLTADAKFGKLSETGCKSLKNQTVVINFKQPNTDG